MPRQDLQTNSDTAESEKFNKISKNTKSISGLKNDKYFPERLGKEHIKTLPVRSFDGKIHLITEMKDLDGAIKTLRKCPVLGFDTETRPVFRKGVKHKVSLLQLSTAKDAFLFRLNHLGLPNELVKLLEDSSIQKVGVAILDDVRGLQKLRNFQAGGFIELADIAGELGIVTCGLRNLAAIILGVRIIKKAQLSNWERPLINSKQSLYAATDAWICLEMYLFLKLHNLLPKKIIWQMPRSINESSSSNTNNNKS